MRRRKAVPDPVGVETFQMLKAAEDDHLGRITAVYEEAKKGKVAADACQFHDFEAVDKKALLERIAQQKGKIPKACLDDVTAIETGMAPRKCMLLPL